MLPIASNMFEGALTKVTCPATLRLTRVAFTGMYYEHLQNDT